MLEASKNWDEQQLKDTRWWQRLQECTAITIWGRGNHGRKSLPNNDGRYALVIKEPAAKLILSRLVNHYYNYWLDFKTSVYLTWWVGCSVIKDRSTKCINLIAITNLPIKIITLNLSPAAKSLVLKGTNRCWGKKENKMKIRSNMKRFSKEKKILMKGGNYVWWTIWSKVHVYTGTSKLCVLLFHSPKFGRAKPIYIIDL